MRGLGGLLRYRELARHHTKKRIMVDHAYDDGNLYCVNHDFESEL